MTSPTLPALYGWFDDGDELPGFAEVPVADVPRPYHGLLVHTHHMTVTVEAYYQDRVSVRVLNRVRRRDVYARKILLELEGDRRIVQFGIVTIRLDLCSEPVRETILSEAVPLGRILIEHDVLRWIELTAFLRVEPRGVLREAFGTGATTYGRLGYIFCDGQPAIELLEILAPIAAGDPETN